MHPEPPAQLALDPRRIDVWCAFLADIDAARRWRQYPALLDEGERRRARALRRPADRRRHVAARALVRTVLSRYRSPAPQDWRFIADAHGRPQLSPEHQWPELQFNIAHTAGVVVLAVTAGAAVGVDVETSRRRTDTVALERYFAPTERAALEALPAAARRRRFFELWTLKEAYLKARGLGLRLPLAGFAFEYCALAGLQIQFTGACPDTPQRWALAQLCLRGRYLLALCAERHAPQPATLALYETVPLGEVQSMKAQVLRALGFETPATQSILAI
jgi:4'-phosphopantetheinyl transferase